MASEPFSEKLHRLRAFSGAAETFWPLYLDLLAHAAEAAQGVILAALGTAADRNWRELARQSVATGAPAQFPPDFIARLADAARGRGLAEAQAGATEARTSVLGLAVSAGEDAVMLAVLVVQTLPPRETELRAQRLLLLADLPANHFATRRTAQARADLAKVTGTLDLLHQLNPHREFLPAAMALCNEFAARFSATQVSLAWVEGRYLRLQAVSNLAKFSPKMDAARDLEAVMEEALDQDDEIIWPAAQGATAVVREHGLYSSRHHVPFLVSIPLRERGAVAGVVHLHRADAAFTPAELAALRVHADQAAPWLGLLWRFGRGGWERWKERGRETLGKFWGVENAWT